MRAREFITEAPIKLGSSSRAKKFIDDLRFEFEVNPLNENEIVIPVSPGRAYINLTWATGGTVHLSYIRTYPAQMGIGAQAIKLLQDRISDANLELSANIDDKSTVPKNALRTFFKKLGFRSSPTGAFDLVWQPEYGKDSEMKINEVISRGEAERRFAQLSEPKTPRTKTKSETATDEPAAKTHVIRQAKLKPVARDLRQINRDFDSKIRERLALSAKLEQLTPRVMKFARENMHSLPDNVVRFNYKPWIEDSSLSMNPEHRLDSTIEIMKRVVETLQLYLKYPDRFRGKMIELGDYIELAAQDRAQRQQQKTQK